MGSMGILLLLKKRGLFSAETTWLKINQLADQHGLYVSPQLLQQIENQLLSS